MSPSDLYAGRGRTIGPLALKGPHGLAAPVSYFAIGEEDADPRRWIVLMIVHGGVLSSVRAALNDVGALIDRGRPGRRRGGRPF